MFSGSIFCHRAFCRANTINVIGNGCVVDPEELLKEMKQIEDRGYSMKGLSISDRANVIVKYHKMLDGAEERQRGAKGVGTTGRGIGPCYSDKISRSGIRMCDILDEEALKEKMDLVYPVKEKYLHILDGPKMDAKDELTKGLLASGKRLEQYVVDASVLVNDALKHNRKVLFEGAQGTMLDIDHGTYPYVTSSNCISGGICTGVGVGPNKINEVLGVTKAYTTRVGAGPFPTELNGRPGKVPPHQGRGMGDHHWTSQALRLAGPGGGQARVPAERPDGPGGHQARRPEQHEDPEGRHRLRDRRQEVR